MSGPLWLSHHREDELHRTYRLGRWRVCARCLGTYPTLVAVLALQLALRAPLSWPLDKLVALGLLAPALLDWAAGRFRPRWGNNAVRTATGAALGVALGRTLYIHFQQPFPALLQAQLGLALVVVVAVSLVRLVTAR